MRMGSIYKIYCICTEKVYIGQTVQHPPIKRWVEHYSEMNRMNNELYIYRAFRKWGIENFTFQVLEQDIPLKELNAKEQWWIEKYKANHSTFGYNLTAGGVMTVKSIITEEIAKQIINDIRYRTEMTFVELANFYNVSREVISDINCGETWYFKNECYPIRDNSALKNVLTQENVYEIYALLAQKMSLTDIAKKYSVSVTNISNINQGKIYKLLGNDQYPLFLPVNSKKWLGREQVEEILTLLKTTDYIYAKIGDIVGVGRKTVSGINNGVLYRQILDEIGIVSYPIR